MAFKGKLAQDTASTLNVNYGIRKSQSLIFPERGTLIVAISHSV
jgi:hypothetical protein